MNINLKKELTFPQEHSALLKAILKHFKGRAVPTHTGVSLDVTSLNSLENLLGLPYTSTSDYAGLWVTNTEAYFDREHKFHYIGFAMDENGQCVAILWDKDENELIVNI